MTQTPKASSTRYQPAYQTVAVKIAELIRTRDLKPGDRLPGEHELSAQLGVSRTVVREAVKVLVATSQIDARKGSGLFVSTAPASFLNSGLDISLPIEPVQVQSLFELRVILETQNARIAARRIAYRQVRELEEIVRRNQTGAEQVDIVLFDETDNAFHLRVAEATQNPFLAPMLAKVLHMQNPIVDLILNGNNPGSLLFAAQQHVAILTAIKESNEDQAELAMRAHLNTVMECYEQEARRRLSGPSADAPSATLPNTPARSEQVLNS